MRKLLIPLLAAITLPTAVNAEEFTEIKPKNLYSYQESSLVKFNNEEGERFIRFVGTTKFPDCFASATNNTCLMRNTSRWFKKLGDKSTQNLILNYEINCDNQTFNREGDSLMWNVLFIDQTAVGVYQKYCPLEEWSKLPNK